MPRKQNPWSLRREAAHLSSAETPQEVAGPDPTAIRAAAVDWIGSLVPWDLFGTLTYDPAKVGYVVNQGADFILPPSGWAAARHFARWADTVAFRAGREVLAVGALEATKQGWPHFHVLIAMGGCDPGLFQACAEEWFKPHGYCRLDRVDAEGSISVAAYLAKYFTKDSVDIHIRGERPGKVHPGQRWLTGLRVERSKPT